MTSAATLPREKLTCKGSNHVPGCEHLAPEALPPVFALVDVAHIAVGSNVRHDPGDLEELAASIREHGVLQPIEVVPNTAADNGTELYVLVYGQRRLAAAKLAGLTRIPAIVKPDPSVGAPGAKRSIEQLVENLHRADLNAVDRARAMREVVDAGMSQADLARELGLHNSTIANDLGILEAPAKVLAHVAAGRLTASHAKAIKGLPSRHQEELAANAIARGQSAHELERQAGYTRESVKREEADKSRLLKVAKSAIDALGKVAAKDALIVVNGSVVTSAIKAAGWKNISKAESWDVDVVANAGECGCATWRVEYSTYGGGDNAKVRPVCADVKHRQARADADRAARDAKERGRLEAAATRAKTRDAERAAIAPAIQTAFAAIDPAFRRTILWAFVDDDCWDVERAFQQRHAAGDMDGATNWDLIAELADERILDELAESLASKLLVDGYPADEVDPVRLATLAALGIPVDAPAKQKRRAKAG